MLYKYTHMHAHTLVYMYIHTQSIHTIHTSILVGAKPSPPFAPKKRPPSLRIEGTIAAKKDGGKEFLVPRLMKWGGKRAERESNGDFTMEDG